MFEKLAIFAGVFDKLNLPRINSLEDEKKEDEPYLKEEEVACIDKNILQAVFGNLMKKV